MYDIEKNNMIISRCSNLLCEYAKNPIGIESDLIRLSWQFSHIERDQIQSAYRIIASSSLDMLNSDKADLWDSGKVLSDDSVNIEYKGKKLFSGDTCYWKVCAWDKNDRIGFFSEPAKFEIGLLEAKDWDGKWMGFIAGRNGGAIYFRKDFKLLKSAKKARAYICGLGYYELSINGEKIGDHVLDPGFTEYNERVLYVTYDVTSYLRSGDNTVGIVLGNGWHGSPRVIFQMNIILEDGTVEKIFSEPLSGWVSSGGPIIRNSIYDGETYDARLEKTGWDTPDFDIKKDTEVANGWIRSMIVNEPAGKLVPQKMEAIKVVHTLEPIKVSNPKVGIYVFDMGQNITGWVRLSVEGPAGTQITIKFAENIYDDGCANQENLRTALAKDTYILSGKSRKIWEPKFTYHGFRYVQIEGYPGVPDKSAVLGCVVHSDVESSGEFNCGNDLINKIQKSILWTESGNLHSIPTDCPQRDERVGWLNDLSVRAEEAMYNFNMSRFFPKWLDDIRDAQDKSTGAITDTAPYIWGRKPADPVSSCNIIIPWNLYLFYGDVNVLEKNYESMKNWLNYLKSISKNNIIDYSIYGDWASPIENCEATSEGGGAVSVSTPGELMSTGYFYYCAFLLAKIAGILLKNEDQSEFENLSKAIKNDFNTAFFNEKTCNYGTGSQSCNSFALFLDVVPAKHKKKLVENLVDDIVIKKDYHLSTGNQCTKYIMEVLVREGHLDLAYNLACQETYPSWGYMIKNGATTIWERWEYATNNSMNSHNHPMFASIGSWYYKYLAGIKPGESSCGFKSIILEPHHPKGLPFANASIKTVRGIINSGWEKNEKSINYNFFVPANTSAEIIFNKSNFNYLDEVEIFENQKLVWANGVFFETEGLKSSEENEKQIKLNVGSGEYKFYVKAKNQEMEVL